MIPLPVSAQRTNMSDETDDRDEAEPGVSPAVIFTLTSLAVGVALLCLWLYLAFRGSWTAVRLAVSSLRPSPRRPQQ
jgi:hypothetical protein